MTRRDQTFLSQSEVFFADVLSLCESLLSDPIWQQVIQNCILRIRITAADPRER